MTEPIDRRKSRSVKADCFDPEPRRCLYCFVGLKSRPPKVGARLTFLRPPEGDGAAQGCPRRISAVSPTFVLVASSKNLGVDDHRLCPHPEARVRVYGYHLRVEAALSGGSMILATMDEEIIEPPDLDAYFSPQAYIFLSTHWAESGIPSLTVHTTGNFTDKEVLGARPREVAHRPRPAEELPDRAEREKGPARWLRGHHRGDPPRPHVARRPVLFVELGSTREAVG